MCTKQTWFLNSFFFTLGWVVSEEQLQEVANESGVLDASDDFLEPEVEFRQACERAIRQPEDVAPKNIQNAFLFPKQNITMPELPQWTELLHNDNIVVPFAR